MFRTCCIVGLSSIVCIFWTMICPLGPCWSRVLGGSCCKALSCEPDPAPPIPEPEVEEDTEAELCTVTLGGPEDLAGVSEYLGTAWMTPPVLVLALGDTGDTPALGLEAGWRRPVVGDNMGIPPLSCRDRLFSTICFTLF